MSETATAAVPRDVRVDQIGFVNELVSQHANNLKTALKVRMDNDSIERVRGDVFEGLLVSTFVSTVPPAKLLALYEKDKITRAQFLSALSVRKEPLEAFLSGDEIRRISETTPGNPQLRVNRIKGVELKLVDAVKGLSVPAAG